MKLINSQKNNSNSLNYSSVGNYIESNERQKEEMREIEKKTLKLKVKEKSEREILKKIKNKHKSILMSSGISKTDSEDPQSMNNSGRGFG